MRTITRTRSVPVVTASVLTLAVSAGACGGSESTAAPVADSTASVPGAAAPTPTPDRSAPPAPEGTAPIGTVAAAPDAGPSGVGSCSVTMTGSVTAQYEGGIDVGAVTSGYWLSDEERASYEATLGGPPQPLLLNCGTADGLNLVTISANDEADLSFGPGQYEINAVAFHPDVMGYILPPEGEPVTATITAFDDQHVAGSVSFTDPSTNGAPVTVELTFDFPRT